MKGFVSNRRVSILAWASSLSILWALFVVPGGQPWAGLVWLGALAFLLVSSVALILGAAMVPSLAPAIQAVDSQGTGRKS